MSSVRAHYSARFYFRDLKAIVDKTSRNQQPPGRADIYFKSHPIQKIRLKYGDSYNIDNCRQFLKETDKPIPSFQQENVCFGNYRSVKKVSTMIHTDTSTCKSTETSPPKVFGNGKPISTITEDSPIVSATKTKAGGYSIEPCPIATLLLSHDTSRYIVLLKA